jgi:hypothetical protein
MSGAIVTVSNFTTMTTPTACTARATMTGVLMVKVDEVSSTATMQTTLRCGELL